MHHLRGFFSFLHLLGTRLGAVLSPQPMGRGGREQGAGTVCQAWTRPLHTKAASFTIWGQAEPQPSGQEPAEAAQARGCDGGGHRGRGGTRVLLLTRHPLLRGAGGPLATSPWVTFLGCGLAPEHPSARPRPGYHPGDARLHPGPARLCVSVTAGAAAAVSGAFADWKRKLSFCPRPAAQPGGRFIRETLAAPGVDAATGRAAGAGSRVGPGWRAKRLKPSAEPEHPGGGKPPMRCRMLSIYNPDCGPGGIKIAHTLKGQVLSRGRGARDLRCLSWSRRRPGDPPHPVLGVCGWGSFPPTPRPA